MKKKIVIVIKKRENVLEKLHQNVLFTIMDKLKFIDQNMLKTTCYYCYQVLQITNFYDMESKKMRLYFITDEKLLEYPNIKKLNATEKKYILKLTNKGIKNLLNLKKLNLSYNKRPFNYFTARAVIPTLKCVGTAP